MIATASKLRSVVPPPAVAAVTATVALLLFLLWQNAMDGTPPLGLGALKWFETLTPLDRRLLTLVLLIPGAVLWLWALRADAPRPVVADTPASIVPLDQRRSRGLLVGSGLVLLAAVLAPLLGEGGAGLGIIGYGQQDRFQNGFQPVGTLLWLVGAALVLWALHEPLGLRSRLERLAEARAVHVTVTVTTLAVLLITALAAYFRLSDLNNLPFEMTSDHTEKLLDIRDVLRGSRPVFMPLNGGREPLQFYWTAALSALGLPFSFGTLKVGAALVSVATVPLVYLLGRAVVGPSTGLLAALALTLAPWHLQITRIALRTGWSALFAAIALWLLVRALDGGRRNDWLLLGASLAAGLYGYSGFRPMVLLVPLVVIGKLAGDAWRRRPEGAGRTIVPRATAVNMASAAAAFLVVLAPLIRYAVDRPADFWGRTLSRVTGTEVALARSPALQLLINLKNALLMFNDTSDGAWFHSPPGRPALETVGGALLLAGVLTAAYRVRHRDWRSAAMLLAVPVMLLASALALAFPGEVPHLSRASGALPAVAVLIALGLPPLGRLWRAALGRTGSLIYLVLLTLLFVPMATNTVERAFVEYRAGYDNASHPTQEGADVAQAFLGMGGDLRHVYLVSWPHGWDYRALGLLLGDPDWDNVLEGVEPEMADAVRLADAHSSDPAAKLYLVGGPRAQANVAYLRTLYPDAVITPHASRMPGKDFLGVYVPPAGPSGAPDNPQATQVETPTPAVAPASAATSQP